MFRLVCQFIFNLYRYDRSPVFPEQTFKLAKQGGKISTDRHKVIRIVGSGTQMGDIIWEPPISHFPVSPGADTRHKQRPHFWHS